MIPEEMLCAAAVRSCEIYTAKLENGYISENQHTFSSEFERKIQRLKRKADHPVFYRVLQRAAVIFLVMFIGGGAVLGIHVEAREAFFGWMKGIYKNYITYYFRNENAGDGEMIDYRPTWLPDGYREIHCDDSEDTVFIDYENDAGQRMSFMYSHNPNEAMWFINPEEAIDTNVVVNGSEAHLFTSINPDSTSAIMWSINDDTAFFISAFLEDHELIRMAESVSPIEKTNNK